MLPVIDLVGPRASPAGVAKAICQRLLVAHTLAAPITHVAKTMAAVARVTLVSTPHAMHGEGGRSAVALVLVFAKLVGRNVFLFPSNRTF